MDINKLNPLVRSVSLYEKINRTEYCVAQDCRIIYLISGELTYGIGAFKEGELKTAAKKSRLSPGMLLFIPAGTPYCLKSKYMRAIVITFLPFAKDELQSRISPVAADAYKPEALCSEDVSPFDKVILIEDMEAERDGLLRMNNIFTSSEGYYLAELSAMLKLLLLKIVNLTDESALPSSMVENLDGYIRENVQDEISNTELGAIFGYHPFYISRMLKSKKGITLHQYVISYRLKCAKRLLECSDKSIADIAEETGFTDASYFTKIFKAQLGMTPKEYRNSFKEDFI